VRPWRPSSSRKISQRLVSPRRACLELRQLRRALRSLVVGSHFTELLRCRTAAPHETRTRNDEKRHGTNTRRFIEIHSREVLVPRAPHVTRPRAFTLSRTASVGNPERRGQLRCGAYFVSQPSAASPYLQSREARAKLAACPTRACPAVRPERQPHGARSSSAERCFWLGARGARCCRRDVPQQSPPPPRGLRRRWWYRRPRRAPRRVPSLRGWTDPSERQRTSPCPSRSRCRRGERGARDALRALAKQLERSVADLDRAERLLPRNCSVLAASCSARYRAFVDAHRSADPPFGRYVVPRAPMPPPRRVRSTRSRSACRVHPRAPRRAAYRNGGRARPDGEPGRVRYQELEDEWHQPTHAVPVMPPARAE